MGFIDKEGALFICFRKDLVWNAAADTSAYGIKDIRESSFRNGRCLVQKTIVEIPVYGFIDTTGSLLSNLSF